MIRTCSACGASNRVPARHLSHAGRCGSCKAALPPAHEPMDVDEAEFDAITRESPVPVLVDFWAEWCGPCRMAAPHVKNAAQQLGGRALVLKVDTEANPALAQRFGVRSIPHFMVMRGGRPVMAQSGLVDARQMTAWLEQAGA